MPPPISSSSLLSFTKRIIRSAGQAKRAIRTLPIRPLRVVQETFPSLRPSPISINPSARITPPKHFSRPFSSSRSAFARAGYRPTPFTPRGPSMTSNVGLGVAKARSFASAPQGIVQGKVPIGLRALAHLLNSDDQAKGNIPRASRYKPYSKQRNHRLKSRRLSTSTISIDSTALSYSTDLKHYFPLPTPSSSGLPTPETLVTPGQQTTLSLPLSPSLNHLLAPSSLSYTEVQIGISIFARLTKSILPIHEAFSSYAQTRVLPLLAKLDSLGVMDTEAEAKVGTEVVVDQYGVPDILRIVFRDRSIRDVKAILGESLREGEEGEWWGLSQVGLVNKAILSKEEQVEISDHWSDSNSHPVTISTIQLVYPTLDTSIIPQSPSLEPSSPTTPISDYSWPTSPVPQPEYPFSLSSSLSFSEMDESTWSVARSEDDEEIESDLGDGLSRVWSVDSGSDGGSVASLESVSSMESVESVLRSGWAGPGEGFGLAQPW